MTRKRAHRRKQRRRFWDRVKDAAAAVYRAILWAITPVSTSMQGKIDAIDWRPIIARALLNGGTAGISVRGLFHDSELAAAVISVLVAAMSGILTAIERANMAAPPAQPPTPPADPPKG